MPEDKKTKSISLKSNEREKNFTLTNLDYQVTLYPLKADEYPEVFQDYQSSLPNVKFVIGEQYRKAGVEEYIQPSHNPNPIQ